MEGRQPKRRKDKYNPYKIYELNEHYYIEFKDSENKLREMEISRKLYEAFSSFELRDISYLHKWDKYIEHSEVTDIRRDNASNQTTESVEDAGCGLVKYGSSLVPFVNRFPTNTRLYKLMTTKPGEDSINRGRM